MLREGKDTLRRRINRAQVPCSVVALYAVLSTWTGDEAEKLAQRTFNFCVYFLGLRVAFIPAIARAAMGMPAFGAAMPEQVYFGFSVVANGLFGGLILWFAFGPCIWYYRQLLTSRCLLELIDLPRAELLQWRSPARRQRAALPRLDLSIPSNVQGWAALRRCLYGRNLAPAVGCRAQRSSCTCRRRLLLSGVVRCDCPRGLLLPGQCSVWK